MDANKIRLVSFIIFLFLCNLITGGCIENSTGPKTCSSLSQQEDAELANLRSKARQQINDGNLEVALSTTYNAEAICHSSIHDTLVEEIGEKMEQNSMKKGQARKEIQKQAEIEAAKAAAEAAENRRIWEEAQKIEEANKAKAEREAREAREAEVRRQQEEAAQQYEEKIGMRNAKAIIAAGFISVRLEPRQSTSNVCYNHVDYEVPCTSNAAVSRKFRYNVNFRVTARNTNTFPVTCSFKFRWGSSYIADTHGWGGIWENKVINPNSTIRLSGSDSATGKGYHELREAIGLCFFNLPHTNEQVIAYYNQNSSTYDHITVDGNDPSEKQDSPYPTTLNINSIPPSSVVLNGNQMGKTPLVGIAIMPGSYTVQFIHPTKGIKSVSFSIKAGQTKNIGIRF